MSYRNIVANQQYHFADLKTLMAKATPLRSGDELAGVAARDATEHVAAQMTLAAKCQYADLIIDNSGSLKQTELTVKKEWEKVLQMED